MTDSPLPPPQQSADHASVDRPAWWKKKRAKLPTWAWIAIGSVVVIAAAGAAGGGAEEEADDDTDTEATTPDTEATTPDTEATEPPETTEAATTTEAPTTTAAPTTTIPDPSIPDGVYVVGTDIQPGVFRVGQYWARLDAAQEIIDNGLTDDCPNIMVVQPTDTYVEIAGGALRIEDSLPLDPIAEGCTDGVFLVNYDVQPGRYSVSGGTGGSSYWARLDATLDIIDNDLGDGTRIVIVEATDFALEINGTLAPMP